jgi:hypothetical protein
MSTGQQRQIWSKERSNQFLKSKQILQLVLLTAGIILVTYGISRGEAAVVLSKAIKLCLECVGIG